MKPVGMPYCWTEAPCGNQFHVASHIQSNLGDLFMKLWIPVVLCDDIKENGGHYCARHFLLKNIELDVIILTFV